jgi:hypothetical protein
VAFFSLTLTTILEYGWQSAGPNAVLEEWMETESEEGNFFWVP